MEKNKYYCNGITLKDAKCKNYSFTINPYFCKYHTSQNIPEKLNEIKTKTGKIMEDKCGLCNDFINNNAYHSCECGSHYHNSCIRQEIKLDVDYSHCQSCGEDLPEKFIKNIIKKIKNDIVKDLNNISLIKNNRNTTAEKFKLMTDIKLLIIQFNQETDNE